MGRYSLILYVKHQASERQLVGHRGGGTASGRPVLQSKLITALYSLLRERLHERIKYNAYM